MAPTVPASRRLLVIRYRFIGDTVLAIPFLRNLRRAFPGAVIDVLTEPGSGDTLAHCPYVNELIWYAPRQRRGRRSADRPPTGLLGCARMLRARGYDRVYILRRSFSSAILPWLAGIPHRVGFATEGRRWLLQRSTPYAAKHEVECFLDVLRADNVPVTDNYNENWSDPAVDARVGAVLASREAGAIGDVATGAPRRRRVFICAKSVFGPKDWALDRFASVIAWLVQERGCDVHFCDAPANAACYQSILAALPATARARCFDWSRELPIRDLNSLLRSMDLAVGVDTGLLHIAASFHVPVVALFGPLDPSRWHPWDTAHTIIRPADVSGQRPLLRVSVRDVIAAIETHLKVS